MAQELMYRGLRLNTNITYSSAQRSFLAFCNKFKFQSVPASEQTIILYLAYTQTRPKPLRSSSLHVYLSAIRSIHVMHGLPSPPIDSPRVKLILKAIFENGPAPSKMLPITFPILHSICSALLLDHDNLVYVSALALGYFGGLRGSEYCLTPSPYGLLTPPLLVGMVNFGFHDNKMFLVVSIPRSKTNPHGFERTIGCSEAATCAVCLLYKYLSVRSSKVQLTPHLCLFQFNNGVNLTKSMLNNFIKSSMSNLGFDPTKYTTHSLRSGVATDAAVAGFSEVQVKAMGNWTSQTYLSYIRQSQTQQLSYAKHLSNIVIH